MASDRFNSHEQVMGRYKEHKVAETALEAATEASDEATETQAAELVSRLQNEPHGKTTAAEGGKRAGGNKQGKEGPAVMCTSLGETFGVPFRRGWW